MPGYFVVIEIIAFATAGNRSAPKIPRDAFRLFAGSLWQPAQQQSEKLVVSNTFELAITLP